MNYCKIRMKVMILGCYLDNAATTRLSTPMKKYLISLLDTFGNPSSKHSEGVKARNIVEQTREKVNSFICSDLSENIYFTSSGSAANTLGVRGVALQGSISIAYSPIAHKSILKTVENLKLCHGVNALPLKIDNYGNIDIGYLTGLLAESSGRFLVVVEYANSELGTIQNIKAISDIVHRFGSRIFVDCTGSVSSIPLDVSSLNIDIATFSAHKIGALKGVGVLYKKNDMKLSPLIFGNQEGGLFAGTENVLGIASLGKAIDLMSYDKTAYGRDYVWSKINSIENIYLIGSPINTNRLINNLYICVKDVDGMELAALMDDIYEIQISTGSACNNGSSYPSPTALAIGMSESDANSCVRISFRCDETKEELDRFCECFETCIKMLR